jgi:bla regulator protein blaR1
MESMSLNRFLLILAQNSMEGGIVVLVVFLAQWVFRKHLPPRWQCALWMLLVVRLLLPCSATSPVSVFNLPLLSGWADDGGRGSASAIGTHSRLPAHSFLVLEPAPTNPQSSAGLVAAGPSEGLGERLVSWVKSSWWSILFWVWLAGFAVMMARILVTTDRLSRKVSHLQPLTYRTVLDVLDNCRNELGVRGRPCIVESPGISSPALHGLFRPRLLLPKGLTVEYSPRELICVFA